MSTDKDHTSDERANRIRNHVLIIIGTLPVLLTVLHFGLPESTHQALVFDHSSFPSYTVFTGAFVHASNMHLYGNLAGYAMTIVYAYALTSNSDGLRWFRRTLLISVFALPVLTNLTSYAVISWQYPSAAPVSRGFSGVVGGFGGVLLVALYRTLRVKYNSAVAWTVGLCLFLILMQLIDIQYTGGLRLAVTGLVGASIVLLTGLYVYEDGISTDPVDIQRVGFGGLLVGLVAVVLSVLVLALFPTASTLVDDGTFTNIFAHAAGFLWGIILSGGLLVEDEELSLRKLVRYSSRRLGLRN
ncbi:hypothetical protein [Halobellus ordinarius]|uniref:hypothetical protein n=1 Tax=Halobellus ordinarius TaxID=3075120 RepID=UPI00287FFBC4|nr:hypothetical protein [Halobellus sp. ZY16]